MAAGTITLTSRTTDEKGITKTILSWTSDASGDVNGTSFTFSGIIYRWVTNPSTTAPTDDYDWVLNDEDGFDVLCGSGANRDTTNTESRVGVITGTDGTNNVYYPVTVSGQLTPVITNAGNAKSGTITIYTG